VSKFLVSATWEDVPHLTPETKAQLLASIPAFQRDARSKGIPQLGSGAIYQISEDDLRIAPFSIPDHWPRAWALDTGWNWNAAVWMALDREAQTLYLYDCLKRATVEPAVIIDAIRARGDWIPGVADAADINKTDGQQTIRLYQRGGLDVQLPDKSVEAGILEVWQLLAAGRLKVFASCGPFFEEYRLYRRDEKGRIVKENDHVLDAVRYLVRSGRARMITKPVKEEHHGGETFSAPSGQAWMGT